MLVNSFNETLVTTLCYSRHAYQYFQWNAGKQHHATSTMLTNSVNGAQMPVIAPCMLTVKAGGTMRMNYVDQEYKRRKANKKIKENTVKSNGS